MNQDQHLFYRLPWVDPIDKKPLTPRILQQDPDGRPLYGALVTQDGKRGYPIVAGIVMGTPELAEQHWKWLKLMALELPSGAGNFQPTQTVDSFGFEWKWDSEPRTDVDLAWRVASRYKLDRSYYAGKLTLDAGSGAGDQSRWLLESKTSGVVSVDLSEAIDVVKQKLGHHRNWVGIRGDLTRLPLADEIFDFVYCEGVIQHTHDSRLAVNELCRVLRKGGSISATHYGYQAPPGSGLKPIARRLIDRLFFHNRRERLSKWDRDKLFLHCGVIARRAHQPIIGPILRKVGYAVYNPRMPTFKTTWSCTYDAFGTHSYQREISGEAFRRLFAESPFGKMKIEFEEGNVLLLHKMGSATTINQSS
ncbi:MAG: class I SAM-dependent methyltransferase [Pseudomonadota bacterium]